MRISVKVKTSARMEEVSEEGGVYIVKTRAQPHEGKANEAVIRILAEYFKRPKSTVRIVTGAGSRNKIIEIIE